MILLSKFNLSTQTHTQGKKNKENLVQEQRKKKTMPNTTKAFGKHNAFDVRINVEAKTRETATTTANEKRKEKTSKRKASENGIKF